MLDFEVLIGKAATIYRVPAGAISVGDVATLNHEVWDNTVASAVFVMQGASTCAQSTATDVSAKVNYPVKRDTNPNTTEHTCCQHRALENFLPFWVQRHRTGETASRPPAGRQQ